MMPDPSPLTLHWARFRAMNVKGAPFMSRHTNRNALDFLKFVFSIMIVLFHSRMMTNNMMERIVINGGAGVEFFFMVSGCLMCASSARRPATGNTGLDTVQFMWNKICRLMPNFLVAYVIAFIVYHYNADIRSIRKIIIDAIKSIPELLFIKNSGIRFPSYNGPTWYISAMLLNMLVLYPLLRRFNDSFYVMAAALMLFILGYFFQTQGTLSNLENWNGWILRGTVRGTAGLCAGCLCYKAGTALGRYSLTLPGKAVFTVIEWGGYIAVFALCCKYLSSPWDYLIFLLLMVSFTITYANISFDERIFNAGIFRWLGTYSYSLYLGHSCWREFTGNIYPQSWTFRQRLVCYLILSVWNGLLIHYLSVLLREIYRENRTRIKVLFFRTENDLGDSGERE